MNPAADDTRLRLAAVAHVQRIGIAGVVTADDLRVGFIVDGERIPLINPQRGIFKPQRMLHVLGIRTVFPQSGRKIWYDDQRRVHEQIDRGDELIDYAFMGDKPEAADNRWLRDARDHAVPILYFLGIAPQKYQVIWPVFVVEWSASELKARIAIGMGVGTSKAVQVPATPVERRYALQLVKQRLHQATFREAVMSAYQGRCAISGLPEPRLLDAAHIISDGDDNFGQAIVPNGLPLSKIHHAAFDANLIGIDPDFRLHVSPQLLAVNDGPMFEHGVKGIVGKSIRLPRREVDLPDRDRLAQRFETFRSAI
jgi:putative restriction endonuclease